MSPARFLTTALFLLAVTAQAKTKEPLVCTLAGLTLGLEETFFLKVYKAELVGDTEEGVKIYQLDDITDPDFQAVQAGFSGGRLQRILAEYSPAFVNRTEWFPFINKYNARYGHCTFFQEENLPYVTDVAVWYDGVSRLELRHRWKVDVHRKKIRLTSRYFELYFSEKAPDMLKIRP